VPSQATNVIIILMMMVALKLADPGMANRAAAPTPYGPYIRPAERTKTPVIELPTQPTYIQALGDLSG
jgi:hypothetical protein